MSTGSLDEKNLPLLHHEDKMPCHLCESRLAQCHPYLAGWVRVVQSRHPDVHVCCGFRNEADQNACYVAKLSNDPWPHSTHNVTKLGEPCSYGVDLFQIDADGQARFQYLFYKKLYEELRANGDAIIWGGLFKTISDSDHFQIDVDKLPNKYRML